MKDAEANAIVVVGAGIVGLCVAHALCKAGYVVQVIDPEAPGSQCSFGNAGAISTGSVAPLAMPGIVKSAAKMLLDADSPLHVPAHYWLRAAPWLLRFLASAKPARVEEIATALSWLFADALENHQALAAEIGCAERVVRTGQLHLYRDATALAKDDASWCLRREHGVLCETFDAEGIRALEPAVSSVYRAGVFMPGQGAVTEPYRYANAIADALRARGGVITRDRVQGLHARGSRWEVQGADRSYPADRVVIAAGVWSAQLLRPLGVHVPLESQRGYHLHIAQPNRSVQRPVVLADRKVFMVPMETGLRVSGTVEFGGIALPPTERRVSMLGVYAKEGLPGLRIGTPTRWMGHRPCLPDSLPVIGPVPQHAGLWCAFGHGHLGVTGSVNTGRLIAAALRGELSESDEKNLAAFSVARFS